MAAERDKQLAKFLKRLELQQGMHILMHSAFRTIRTAFPGLTIDTLIDTILVMIGPDGSLVMPAFTYNFKKTSPDYTPFDRQSTPGKVGAIPEVFRRRPLVIRTASPTHSFALWGKISRDIGEENNPPSPLGAGSVLEWLRQTENTQILLLGTNFRALSFGHYLEIEAALPWAGFSPWERIGVLPVGCSNEGEKPLSQIPGCSKPFVHFEEYLLEKKIIRGIESGGLHAYLIPVDILYREGMIYFQKYPDRLLCPQGTCQPCDARWVWYLGQLKNTIQSG